MWKEWMKFACGVNARYGDPLLWWNGVFFYVPFAQLCMVINMPLDMLIEISVKTNNLITNVFAKLFLINISSINNNGIFWIQKYVIVV
jgi:hypothetical protein